MEHTGAIPRAPTAGGATDSLAPYVVGARAAGALTGLGLKIRDALTYLGLVLSGAGVLVDIWQAVQEDDDSWEKNRNERCLRWYDNIAAPACRRLRSVQDRGACWKKAADDLADCMAGRNKW